METKERLRYQRLFRKTSSGRDIDCSHIILNDPGKGKDASDPVGVIMGTIDSIMASTGDSDHTLAECINCRLLLDQASFYNGCPNCGSKDFDVTPHGAEVRRQK